MNMTHTLLLLILGNISLVQSQVSESHSWFHLFAAAVFFVLAIWNMLRRDT